MKKYHQILKKSWNGIKGTAIIVALIIATWSLIVTIDSVYGNAKLRLEYSLGGIFDTPIDFFIYRNNSIMFQFIVKNVGHGSTVYTKK